mmetsp:Transcript_33992/g.74766  ORF Transcript_33992/g.74766 Transcript_33992/m.74766 type:complete len:441 (+) Transcript_33992:69-1391(+)
MNSNACRSITWRRIVGSRATSRSSSLTTDVRRRRGGQGQGAGAGHSSSIRCFVGSSCELVLPVAAMQRIHHAHVNVGGANATKGQARRCYISDTTRSTTAPTTRSNDCYYDGVSSDDDDDSHQRQRDRNRNSINRSPFLKHSLSDGTLRQQLRAGQPMLGCVTGIHNDTDHVEVIGLLGYDFLWADAEHSTATPATIANQIMAAERRGLPTLVRIGYGYHNIIGHSQKYLVAGAQGIILPQCESSDDVRMIVDAVKFPPLGRRGLAGERWNAWGLGKEEEEQQQQEEEEGPPLGRRVQMANDNSVVGVVVESRRGIDALDDILSVKEVDFVFVAPTDLSSDVGLHGQIRHPDVVDMIDEAGRAIRAAGVSSGMLALTGDDYVFWRNRGFEVMAGVATNMFIDGATSLLHAARAHEITAARDGIATSIDDKGNRNGGATKS